MFEKGLTSKFTSFYLRKGRRRKRGRRRRETATSVEEAILRYLRKQSVEEGAFLMVLVEASRYHIFDRFLGR